jgi:hypothetical protein
MKHKDFEDFLLDKFAKENPQVLDDEYAEAFDEWLADLDVDQFIKYGDQYKKEGEA